MKTIIVLLLMALPTLAMAQTGTISGNVVDAETHSPIHLARICIPALEHMVVKTDAAGNFAVQSVPVKKYCIDISHLHHWGARISVEPVDARNTYIRIELRPHPKPAASRYPYYTHAANVASKSPGWNRRLTQRNAVMNMYGIQS